MGNYVKVKVATTARVYEDKIYDANTTTFRQILADAGCDGLNAEWAINATKINNLDATLASMGFTAGNYQLTSISKRANA